MNCPYCGLEMQIGRIKYMGGKVMPISFGIGGYYFYQEEKFQGMVSD